MRVASSMSSIFIPQKKLHVRGVGVNHESIFIVTTSQIGQRYH